jgi:signal transduction histidine kinase
VTVEDNDTATHVYRIVQEAIQNAVRHGQPSQIDVSLETDAGRTMITIQDDGRGFAHKAITPSGTGHRIMQYRAELIGAELGIHSKVGEGTLIVCKLKL